jgi:hypothetical protein
VLDGAADHALDGLGDDQAGAAHGLDLDAEVDVLYAALSCDFNGFRRRHANTHGSGRGGSPVDIARKKAIYFNILDA